jgi:hypothetical protein
MKIIQCLESGELTIQLENNEKYDREEHLQALTEFGFSPAINLDKLTNSYKQVVEGLEVLEKNR